MRCLRACALAQFSRAAWYRRSGKDQSPLRLRIRELAHARPRFGYLRIWVLLRREGWLVNRKRVRRLYRLEGLAVAHAGASTQTHRAAPGTGAAPRSALPSGGAWTLSTMPSPTGGPFRGLTVVDQWSRQSPILEVASRMSGETVGSALDRAIADGQPPRSITVDHGTEFMSRALKDWAHGRGVQLDFIRPGKPVENASLSRLTGDCATSA